MYPALPNKTRTFVRCRKYELDLHVLSDVKRSSVSSQITPYIYAMIRVYVHKNQSAATCCEPFRPQISLLNFVTSTFKLFAHKKFGKFVSQKFRKNFWEILKTGLFMIATYYTLNNTVSFDSPSLSTCSTAAFNVWLSIFGRKANWWSWKRNRLVKYFL